MISMLLAIIYLAFISLGLPDSLLGSAWPIMHTELSAPLSVAGIITMIIAAGTIVSSLLSDRLTRKFGASLVTAVSVLLTAVALFGFSVSKSFFTLCLWSIPYGLGAGAVDAALNNYVALHFSSRHMSWLHCFWGVGASISPYIMSYCLTGGLGWRKGYFSVSLIQIVISAILFISLPLWKKRADNGPNTDENINSVGVLGALKIKGILPLLTAFFCYSIVEQTAMLWASSYLVEQKSVNAEIAAGFASLFMLGITFGRFISGFVADRLGDKRLIRIGVLSVIFGAALVCIPTDFNAVWIAGLIIIGLGSAPIYPSIIHATPDNFGKENSQAIIGIQMAAAYLGTTLMPMIFGFISGATGIVIFPFYLLAAAVLMLIMTERLNRIVAKR